MKIILIVFLVLISACTPLTLKEAVERDFRDTLKEAERGNHNFQLGVGRAYLSGCSSDAWIRESGMGLEGCKMPGRDYAEAKRRFQIAADRAQNNVLASAASYNIGFMYLRGLGVQRDWEEAARWFNKSLNKTKDFVPAYEHLSMISTVKKRGITEQDDKAITTYRSAAEKGNATAQYKLGILYWFGIGIAQNDAEAIRWLRKAADQGHSYAQTSLGVIYDKTNFDFLYDSRIIDEGNLIEDGNNAEAINWYLKAANQGDAYAQFRVGLFYIFAKHDYSEAIRVLRKSADQGLDLSQRWVGDFYNNYWGTSLKRPKDLSEAARFYRMAADQGHLFAYDRLQKTAPKQASVTSQKTVPESNDKSSFLGIAGALIAGAAVGAVSPGDTLQQITTGLQAATIATNQLVSKDLAEQQRMAEMEKNASNLRIQQSATNNNTISSCPSNFNHLSDEMPAFNDPNLREIRRDILATNLAGIIAAAKQQGMSKNQAISLALRQADEFESTARINAKAGAGVSTELTTRGIVTAVRTGRLALDIPCSGSASMVQAAQCGVIMQIWGAKANREQAKYMETCW